MTALCAVTVIVLFVYMSLLILVLTSRIEKLEDAIRRFGR